MKKHKDIQITENDVEVVKLIKQFLFYQGFTYVQIDPKVNKVISSNKLKNKAPNHIAIPKPNKDRISRQ